MKIPVFFPTPGRGQAEALRNPDIAGEREAGGYLGGIDKKAASMWCSRLFLKKMMW
jgi:hypothetical protein